MKKVYRSENNLNTFVFHDAYIENVRIENRNMIWTLYCVNITKENKENTYPTDMRLGCGKLVFKNISDVRVEKLLPCLIDEKNQISKVFENEVLSNIEG